MSSKKYTDLKYDDETLTIEELLKKEKLPIAVRICQTRTKALEIDISKGQEILLQQTSREIFAHVKVLRFYDNEKMQTQKGAEYVLEHETYVGKEYLMPLEFPGYVKLARRPGSRGRYLTIKQVIGDCPAFVKVEQDTKALLANDTKQTVTIDAMTVLEFKKLYESPSDECLFAEFRDRDKTYTFRENDKVNFTTVEKDILYSLDALPQFDLLPKVILFKGVTPENIVLQDQILRSALSTIVEGPIEVLGFVYVENIVCWTRNKHQRTYETALIPKRLWSKVYTQKRCFHSEEDKNKHLLKKFGPCLGSQFVSNSLYFLQLNIPEVTWLRCPQFFKQHLEGNTLYDVLKIPFNDSSDEDDVYQVIEEPVPKIPASRTKIKPAEIDHKKNIHEPLKANIDVKPNTYQHSKSRQIIKTEDSPKIGGNVHETTERLLPSIPGQKKNARDQFPKYTQLDFSKPSRVYETLDVYGDSLPLGYSRNIPEKSQQYLEVGQVKRVLEDNQIEEDFYNYSVKEVSFCLEHCGMKSLADMCYDRKLDGSFFKGFSDWKELNLSSLDVIILKKVIYEGWRSKDDSTYAVSTHM